MELRQLRYFVRIVETGSMSIAALDLGIGVSALSQQMTRLENELSIRLLQRTSRGVTPTNAGLAFYSQAQLALRHADDAILASREARLSGHVSVGMAPSTASILGIPASSSRPSPWKRNELLADIPDDTITPAQLANIPLIMPSQGHGLRGRLEAICQEHGLKVDIATEIDGLTLLMRAVSSGLGATLQPGAAISHLEREALRVIGVHNPVLSRPNFLVSLSDDELTPAGLAVRVILTKVMRELVETGHWPGATLYAP